MPGSMPATSQLDSLSSTTAIIVLFWSRATRDLLRSFGWGIAALHRLHAATKLPSPRRPPHSVSRSLEPTMRDDRLRSLGGEAFGDERCVRHRIRDIRRRRASFFLDLGEQPTLKRGSRALLRRMIVGETA